MLIGSFVNIISFNIPSATCYSTNKVDYLTTLMMTTLLPLFVAALLWFLYKCEVVYYCLFGSENQNILEINVGKQAILGRYFTLFLMLTYVVLPSVSGTIAQAYSCTDVDPSDVALGEDYYLRCVTTVSCVCWK